MNNQSNNPLDKINHIKCDVTECKYHGHQDECQAEMITVTPNCANCVSKQDTSCATFET